MIAKLDSHSQASHNICRVSLYLRASRAEEKEYCRKQATRHKPLRHRRRALRVRNQLLNSAARGRDARSDAARGKAIAGFSSSGRKFMAVDLHRNLT
jgi:hypothetical protein